VRVAVDRPARAEAAQQVVEPGRRCRQSRPGSAVEVGTTVADGGLQRILDSLTGPVAKMISVSAIVVTGLSIAFGEGGAGMKKLLWIVFGISMAFGASSFFLGFFGFAGGVGF
jgi:type IV secretory pathway VirB2 component (pilin)